MEIRPGFILPILRQLQNTTETDTYYVRAVIRNTNTNTVLKTVDLVDNGSYRFTYNWTIPAYSNETYIDVTSTVYIDSGYTQISGYYGSYTENYVIRNQVNFGGGGGNGYGWLTEKELRRIIGEEILKIKMPEMEVNLTPLMEGISLAIKAINDKPITEKTDLSEVIKSLTTLSKDIKGINIPKTDLKPISDALDRYTTEIESLKNAINDDNDKKKGVLNEMQGLLDRIRPFFTDQMDDMMSEIKKLGKKFSNIQTVFTKPYDEDSE